MARQITTQSLSSFLLDNHGKVFTIVCLLKFVAFRKKLGRVIVNVDVISPALQASPFLKIPLNRYNGGSFVELVKGMAWRQEQRRCNSSNW
jgi:hypothetical protein